MTASRSQPLLGTSLMALAAERANRRAIANTRAALALLKHRRMEYEAVRADLDRLLDAREAHLAAQDAVRRRQDRAFLHTVGSELKPNGAVLPATDVTRDRRDMSELERSGIEQRSAD